MIDRSLVRSGFDIEILFSEAYLKYILFSLYESGTIPNVIKINDTISVFIHAPEELNEQRRYQRNRYFNPDPFQLQVEAGDLSDAFTVQILPGTSPCEVKIRGRYSLIIGGGNSQPQSLDLYATISLSSEDVEGFDEKVKLNIEVTDLDSPIFNGNTEGLPITKEEVLQLIQEKVNRGIDLGFVGKDKAVQRIVMRTFQATNSHPAAIGFYINLKLKNGPAFDQYLPDRGNVNDARNFLPTDHNLAFAVPGRVYHPLGSDLKYRMAKLDKVCPELYSYPLDIDGNEARLKSVTVTTGLFNQLAIVIHGELIWEDAPNPDFYIQVSLTPKFDANGILKLEINSSVSGPALDILEIGSVFINVGLFILLQLAHTYLLDNLVTQGVNDYVNDTNFLESLPHRLTIESKRWDPLYDTLHQVSASIVEMSFHDEGIFMLGKQLWIDRAFRADRSTRIKNVVRNALGQITHLDYTMKYSPEDLTQLNGQAAGTDRMPFTNLVFLTANGEYRARLSISEIRDRNVSKKFADGARYLLVKKIVENQVEKLKVISAFELGEKKQSEQQLLRMKIEINEKEQLLARARAFLVFGGCGTDERKIQLQYNKMVNERIEQIIQEELLSIAENLSMLSFTNAEVGFLRAEQIIRLELLGKLVVAH